MDKRVKDIVKSYEDVTGKAVKEVESPCIPSNLLTFNMEFFRSMVGKVIFFWTKLGYKTSSSTRQLASHLSRQGQDHWDALGRLVGYLKQMKLPGIMYRALERGSSAVKIQILRIVQRQEEI